MGKKYKVMRVYKESHDKLSKTSLELSALEGKRVSMPETLKRLTNIPNTKIVLQEDALIKKARRVRN